MPIPNDIKVDSPVKRGRGRPKKGEEKPKLPAVQKAQPVETGAAVRSGVTVNWLAQAMGKDKRTVESRLSGIRPIRVDGRYKYYDFLEAVSKFVAPGSGVSDFLANAKPSELPPALQLAFWQVQEAKMKVAETARDTFRGHLVREVLQRFSYLALEALKTQTAHMKRIAPEDLQKKFDAIQDAQIVKLNTDAKELLTDFVHNLSILEEIIEDEEDGQGHNSGAIRGAHIEDTGPMHGDDEE